MNTKVAVYGSLRKGFGNHVLLSQSELIGTTQTPKEFRMFSLGAFPGVGTGTSSIKVEVYRVNEETLARLDRLEGYHGPTSRNFYEREVVMTEFGQALMYTLRDERYKGHDEVTSGDWVEYRKVNLKDLL
jgi:gamma-glutamylcyclotransferase (GGCT)/AIG2-like uncharacterized protein YtfP|tara:strand:- start:2638 stop:3027 length:390 start_codon:yes stop_codon:yes gene_type:complete